MQHANSVARTLMFAAFALLRTQSKMSQPVVHTNRGIVLCCRWDKRRRCIY